MKRLLMMVMVGGGMVCATPVSRAGPGQTGLTSQQANPAIPSNTGPALNQPGVNPFASKFAAPARLAAVSVTSIPEPGSMLLLGTGLLALSFGARRISRKR